MRRSRRKGQLRRVSSITSQVDFADQDFFLVVRGLGDHAAEGIGQERSAPEFEALARGGIAADVAGLVADAIDHGDVDAVGDGVGALDGLPGVVLRPRRTPLSPPDASRSPWDRRASARPAAR